MKWSAQRAKNPLQPTSLRQNFVPKRRQLHFHVSTISTSKKGTNLWLRSSDIVRKGWVEYARVRVWWRARSLAIFSNDIRAISYRAGICVESHHSPCNALRSYCD